MVEHAVVFAVALVTVLVATPVVKWAATRAGVVAKPGERHIHTRAIPTVGGLAIFGGVLAAIGVASQLEAFAVVFETTSEPEAIVLGAMLVVGLGLIDDTRGISAPAKLAGQIFAAGTLVLFGLHLQFVYVPGSIGIVSLTTDLAALITIVAIVAMINAVNLVDGLDGLAAGVVVIAAGALFAYTQFNDATVIQGASAAPLILAATVGACVGFLFYNFNPASIFMGDTGAMLLGLLLGSAGVSAISGTVAPGRGDFAAVSLPVLVPVLVLAVPFGDTVWTILRRLRHGRALFSPDKEHLHHRLMEIGHSHRRAVLIMYYWSGLIAFAAVGGNLLPRATVVAVLGGGAALAFVFWAVPRLVRLLRPRRRAPAVAAVVPAARQHAAAPAPGARNLDGQQDFVPFFTKSSSQSEKTASDQRKRRSRKV